MPITQLFLAEGKTYRNRFPRPLFHYSVTNCAMCKFIRYPSAVQVDARINSIYFIVKFNNYNYYYYFDLYHKHASKLILRNSYEKHRAFCFKCRLLIQYWRRLTIASSHLPSVERQMLCIGNAIACSAYGSAYQYNWKTFFYYAMQNVLAERHVCNFSLKYRFVPAAYRTHIQQWQEVCATTTDIRWQQPSSSKHPAAMIPIAPSFIF